jgi:hypothetical protein
MALGQPHICITHPCEFCRVTAGESEADVNQGSHGVVAFFPRLTQPRHEELLSERLARLSPSQLRLIEAMVDLYLD